MTAPMHETGPSGDLPEGRLGPVFLTLRGGCSIDGCPRPLYGRGYCEMHWARWRRTGRPEVRNFGLHAPERQAARSLRGHGHSPNATPLERFVAYLDFPDCGCWIWTGTLVSGYGQFKVERVRWKAHRWSYTALVGPIPDGLQIDHLCRTPACVNPDHLEPVTPRINTLRGESIQARNALKTHCDHGHPLSGDNLVVYGKMRACRTCRRRWGREAAARMREKERRGIAP